MDKQAIIVQMISQHRGLQADLGDDKHLAEAAPVDPAAVVSGLQKFAVDLTTHLALENNVFYVELLKDMRAKGQPTEATERFIAEMKGIEQVVMGFLLKYQDPATIAQSLLTFQEELKLIIGALNMRVESEEAGVYLYWS